MSRVQQFEMKKIGEMVANLLYLGKQIDISERG